LEKTNIFFRRPRGYLKYIRVIIIIFLLLNIFLVLVPKETDASLVIVSIRKFDAVSKGANVRPGENLPVNFTGTLVVDKFPIAKLQQINVFLKADPPGDGWTATVTPPMVVIKQRETSVKFRLIVLPPPLEPAGSSKTINVVGTWISTPSGTNPTTYGEVMGASVNVVVEQFYRLNVYEEPVMRYVWPGDSVEYTLTIQNSGNGEDTFEVEIVNDEALIRAGFAVEVIPKKRTVPANNKSSVTVKVHGPTPVLAPWKIANTEISLKVISEGAERNNVNYKQTVPRMAAFYYYENGPYVSEPVWVLLIALIVVIVYVVHRYRKRVRRFSKSKKRGKKKE
jgi:hypothetical protein